MLIVLRNIKLVLILVLIGFNFSIAEKITVSVINFPPYVEIKDGKAYGPFIEIMDLLSKEINIPYEIKHYPNRRAKHVLFSGEVNANFPLGRNKDREERLYWSNPLMVAEYGFFVNTKKIFIPKNIYDFSGKRIGVFGPSNTSESLNEINEEIIKKGLPKIKIDMLPNSTGQNLMKLMANRLDAVFINKHLGEYQINKLNIKNIDYAFSTKRLKYYLGFSKKHNKKEFIDRFNEGINNIEKNGMLNKILRKYNLDNIN